MGYRCSLGKEKLCIALRNSKQLTNPAVNLVQSILPSDSLPILVSCLNFAFYFYRVQIVSISMESKSYKNELHVELFVDQPNF